jgi:ElaB/YqjD/DUF883 family membrane-anchored ribosome-binding protein
MKPTPTHAIRESIEETEQLLKSVAAAGQERAYAVANNADDYVRDNPWRVVGFAAAAAAIAGLVFGAWIARR